MPRAEDRDQVAVRGAAVPLSAYIYYSCSVVSVSLIAVAHSYCILLLLREAATMFAAAVFGALLSSLAISETASAAEVSNWRIRDTLSVCQEISKAVSSASAVYYPRELVRHPSVVLRLTNFPLRQKTLPTLWMSSIT